MRTINVKMAVRTNDGGIEAGVLAADMLRELADCIEGCEAADFEAGTESLMTDSYGNVSGVWFVK